jgi:RHS repeat-associated protein
LLHYDDGGHPTRITSVTDPFGRTASLTYNDDRIASVTDAVGMTSSFRYGASDFMTILTTPYGDTHFATGLSADQFGNAFYMEVTDPMGAKERVEYHNSPTAGVPNPDPIGQPAAFGGPDLNSGLNTGVSLYWDKRAMAQGGQVSQAKIIDWLWSNVDAGASVAIKRAEKKPLENRVWYKYPGQTQPWGPACGPDAPLPDPYICTGAITLAQPSMVGQKLDDGSDQVRAYQYNAQGKITKATDPVGRQTTYCYAANGIDLLQVRQTTGRLAGDPDACLGGAPHGINEVLTTSTYNAQHLPLTVTDAAGQTTTYTYNSFGQMLTRTTPARAGITEPRTTEYAYDGNGYLVQITGPQADATTSYGYDAQGRVRTDTDSDGYTLTYDYDALNRRLRTSHPDGTYEQVIYDRMDPTRTRDRLGRWSETFYDALRRPVAQRDPENRTTVFDWCACGSLDSMRDPNGHVTRWDRDLQGRVTKETRADASTETYDYESTTSRLKRITDAKLQTKTLTYLADDEVQQVTYSNPSATPNVSFTYDPNYRRLSSYTDGAGTTHYAYYSIGTPPTVGAGRLQSLDGPFSNDTVIYTYDELGRRLTSSMSGIGTVTHSYDSLWRLASIVAPAPLGPFTFSYVGTSDRLSRVSYPNGQTTDYSYFSNLGDKRLSQILHRVSATGSVLSKFDYTYDVEGNLATWAQQYGAGAANTYIIHSDGANQVAAATYQDASQVLKRYNYFYDDAGNRTGDEIDGLSTTATYNVLNQLTNREAGAGSLHFVGTTSQPSKVTIGVPSNPAQTTAGSNKFEGDFSVPSGISTVPITATNAHGDQRTNNYQVNEPVGTPAVYLYDANGNLWTKTEGPVVTTYEWDGENRLVRVSQGVTELARFSYDGIGRRYQKVAGGKTRTYIYDGNDLIQERVSDGTTYGYLAGPGIDRLLARTTLTTPEFYLADHLGSIVQMTNTSGVVTVTRQYDPWGNPLQGGSTSGHAFTGREWDAETGLYYNRARYYDPKIGRFLSPDPIGLAGGINLYAYVLNQSLRFRDPFGLEEEGGGWFDKFVDWVADSLSNVIKYLGDLMEVSTEATSAGGDAVTALAKTPEAVIPLTKPQIKNWQHQAAIENPAWWSCAANKDCYCTPPSAGNNLPHQPIPDPPPACK